MESHSRQYTYFLSDFHLGSRWFNNPLEAEKRVVAFLDSVKEKAKAIYLLGDILDYWFEYRYVVPRGYVRFFGKLAELSDSGVKITWLIGNHDIWIFDYLPRELGIEVVDGELIREIDGKRFFMAHGDGEGRRPLRFRFIRSFFRNRFCQKLYSAIHPRWTVPLAYGWSHKNRGTHPEAMPYLGKTEEPLMQFAADYLADPANLPPDYFIFGHRHILANETIEVTLKEKFEAPENGTSNFTETRRARALILGEWIDLCSFAEFDGNELRLRRFENSAEKVQNAKI